MKMVLKTSINQELKELHTVETKLLRSYKKKQLLSEFLYIPMDFDINQFEITSHEEFFKLVKEFKEVEIPMQCSSKLPILL